MPATGEAALARSARAVWLENGQDQFDQSNAEKQLAGGTVYPCSFSTKPKPLRSTGSLRVEFLLLVLFAGAQGIGLRPAAGFQLGLTSFRRFSVVKVWEGIAPCTRIWRAWRGGVFSPFQFLDLMLD